MNLLRTMVTNATLLFVLGACTPKTIAPASYTINVRGQIPGDIVEQVDSVLAERVPLIMHQLSASRMPVVEVNLWQDRGEFLEEFGEPAPSVRGFINRDAWQVHVLYLGVPPGLSTLHEYIHLITVAANEADQFTPIWLWESIAIFESKRPPPPGLDRLRCISPDHVPTLQSLNTHPTNIYRVGNLLFEFLLDEWSYDIAAKLIKNGGDIYAVLGISETTFEQLWLDYIISNYDVSMLQSEPENRC